MSIHIVLYQPEIPANTGNIARTCLATNSILHLVRPLGFSTDDKMVRRAGLDYWKHVDVREYDSLDALYDLYPNGDYYYIENYGETYYTECDYSDPEREVFFVFGRETVGFPKTFLAGKEDRCLRIPMSGRVRSLNLANTAAIMIFEALRQQNFHGLA